MRRPNASSTCSIHPCTRSTHRVFSRFHVVDVVDTRVCSLPTSVVNSNHLSSSLIQIARSNPPSQPPHQFGNQKVPTRKTPRLTSPHSNSPLSDQTSQPYEPYTPRRHAAGNRPPARLAGPLVSECKGSNVRSREPSVSTDNSKISCLACRAAKVCRRSPQLTSSGSASLQTSTRSANAARIKV